MISIIVPCYNEERRIGPSLERLEGWLRENLPGAYEVVVANDGSTDRTADIVDEMASRHPTIRQVIALPNHGKGYAVRNGMLAAQGEVRIFTDADLATPPEEILPMLAALQTAPVVIGTRVHPDGTDMRTDQQTSMRRALGRLFTFVAARLVGPGIPDTQCGFKGFRQEAAEAIFTRLRTEGFVFDVEVLCLARRLGFPIAQVPVRWREPGGSRLQVRWKLAVITLAELAKVWWRMRARR
jgi:dolichyl-phosphate beta-glucosyltransferase